MEEAEDQRGGAGPDSSAGSDSHYDNRVSRGAQAQAPDGSGPEHSVGSSNYSPTRSPCRSFDCSLDRSLDRSLDHSHRGYRLGGQEVAVAARQRRTRDIREEGAAIQEEDSSRCRNHCRSC